MLSHHIRSNCFHSVRGASHATEHKNLVLSPPRQRKWVPWELNWSRHIIYPVRDFGVGMVVLVYVTAGYHYTSQYNECLCKCSEQISHLTSWHRGETYRRRLMESPNCCWVLTSEITLSPRYNSSLHENLPVPTLPRPPYRPRGTIRRLLEHGLIKNCHPSRLLFIHFWMESGRNINREDATRNLISNIFHLQG